MAIFGQKILDVRGTSFQRKALTCFELTDLIMKLGVSPTIERFTIVARQGT